MFTKQEAKQIRTEIEDAIAPILRRYDLELGRGSTSYADTLSVKLNINKVKLNDAGVNTASPEATHYQFLASIYRLDHDAVGKEFTVQGGTYVLLGGLPRGQKYQFLAKRKSDGKNYKFPLNTIERFFSVKDAS